MSPRPSPATRVLQHLASVLDYVDEKVPFAPHRFGKRIFRIHLDRAKRAAQADPTWSSIEARRHRDGSGAVTMLSNDLTMTDWITQDRIEEELTPRSWWVEPARRLIHWRMSQHINTLVTNRERAQRGWATRDVWDFDHYLTRVVGEALAELAEQAHGWPDGVYDTFEEWVAALRENSEKLLAYAHQRGENEAVALWHVLAGDPARQEQAEAAFKAHLALEAANLKGAQQSMKWVAKHLGRLWD